MAIRFTSYKKEILSNLQQGINAALETCGGLAEGYAKKNLTHNKSVRTNTLRGSIAHEQIDDRTEAVGTTVKYAPYVEFGHHQEPGRYVPAIKKRLVRSWVPPKPYLKPALAEHREQYENVVTQELKKAIG